MCNYLLPGWASKPTTHKVKEECMAQLKNFFATRWGIIGVGAFIGVFASLLQKWGNPGNMGI